MSDSDVDKSPVSSKRAREASFGEEEGEQLSPQVNNTSKVDPKDQPGVISQLQEQHVKEGETWYLLSRVWYTRWKQYCARLSSPQPGARTIGEQTNPGPINNTFIVDEHYQLAEDLVVEESEQNCVYAVPLPAWNLLVEWYGLHPDSTEPIERNIINTNDNGFILELYPPKFRLYVIEPTESVYNTKVNHTPVITLSRNNTFKEFTTAVKDALDFLPDVDIQTWILKDPLTDTTQHTIPASMLSNSTLLTSEDEEATLGLVGGEYNIAVEEKEWGKFPSDALRQGDSSSSVSSTSSVFANGFNKLSTSSVTPPPPSAIVASPPTPRYTRGVCGLQNLGNTCFMNSALQCLSNTPQLTKYFLADLYKTDLNPDNPLGMKGQVAEAYGDLISKLWSGLSASIAPRDFKYTIGRFNSSFSGYQQHDTQELLAFLLDGLHEDLNRIIKKPYIELPDFDGMKDKEIATRSWDYHRARNDSVIVDLFQGQFKSRLICNECKNVSVTFDPFMYLSLPLPIKKQSKTPIVYVPYDPSERMQRVVVTLSKEASIAHLQKEVAKMMSVEDPNSLLVVEIFSHKVYKVFPQYEPVATIGSSDIIYVYQLPGPVPPLPKKKAKYSYSRYSSLNDEEDEEKAPVDENQLIVFPVYCATVSKSDSTYISERINQFGEPIILAVPYKDANKPELLYHLVSQHVERYTQFKLFEEVSDQQQPILHEIEDDKEMESDEQQQQQEEEDEDQPPQYEAIMAEQSEEQVVDEEKDVEEEEEGDDDDDMDIDPPAAPAKPIHTAAAVTAAGGKRVEPMNNLFAMKVFSSPRYSRGPDELIPSVQSWNNLVDLRERAEAEQKQREEYIKQQERQDDSEEEEEEENDEMEDSIVLPAKMEEEEEEEEVENAAALFATNTTTTSIDLNNKEEEEDDDVDSVKNNSYQPSDDNEEAEDNDSDANFSATIAAPPPPAAPAAVPPVVNKKAPKLPKRKVTCPPSTIIRQGEGILLAWSPKKAQQLFGAARPHANDSGVCTDAWDEIEDLGDPNLDTSQNQQKKQITLSDCMDEFTKEEELSEEDLWYCPKCKQHQRATKKFDLWRMPEIMVVHLKRFSHSRTWRDKIDALIDFPATELDLTDRVLSIEDHTAVKEEDRLIYDLYGVDNHYGGLGGGHYTSFAQNFEDKQWYNFDDSHVTKVDVSDVKTTAAYLLFYKRRRPLNDDPTQTVEEIIKKAQEKQQAAEEEEDKIVEQQQVPLNNYSSSDNEGDEDDNNPHKVMGEDEPIIEFVQPQEDDDDDPL